MESARLIAFGGAQRGACLLGLRNGAEYVRLLDGDRQCRLPAVPPLALRDSTPSADLSVTKTSTPSSVPPGGVTYTLAATNNGPDPATGVVLTDTLPRA